MVYKNGDVSLERGYDQSLWRHKLTIKNIK